MPGPLRTTVNLRAEAKYNVVTEFSNFELHSAAASGNQGLVEYALARGQPINSVIDGVLPLHAACAGGHEQVVKVLIDHGADVNAPRLPRRYSNEKNRDGSSAIIGTTGSTPLHFAAANGNKNVMMTLLLRGAHADRRDKYGVTPAALAEQHGWMECAEILLNWMRNKDRDLRERETNLGTDEFGQASSSHCHRERGGSFGYDEEGSTRKRVQVKRSIDTALNKLKTGSLTPQKSQTSSQSVVQSTLTPPTSPITRTRRADRSPSFSEDGSPPASFDPNARRPSLPQVFNPPTASNPTLRNYKSATLVKASPTPKRPRSAGTGAEQDTDANGTTSSKGGSRKLATKYSFLSLFKKGQGNESSTSVPLERTSSHQVSSSMSMPIAAISNQGAASWNASPLSSSPKHFSSTLESRSSGPLPRSGFRFGSGSPSISASPIPTTNQSNPRHSPSAISIPPHPYSPSRSQLPLAVDLHNALAAQQHSHTRDRSESTNVTGLGISFDAGDESGGSVSSSPPLNRLAVHRMRHNRDRSGSGASNRNAMVFDDDMVFAEGTTRPRSNSRPGILRGHHRTSSSGQASALRALRFDSSSSSITSSRRASDREEPSLRGCTSASSLGRVRRRMESSPRRFQSKSPQSRERSSTPHSRVPDSAPAAIGDFDTVPGDQVGGEDGGDEDESYYGQPIERQQVLNPISRSDSLSRNRGLSIGSSNSSLSPILSAADVGSATSTLNSEFPFSINRPPPMVDDSSEGSSQQLLQVPPVTLENGRGRGDSVSSTSTTDSAHNPSLSLSGSATSSASGGSITVTTPLRSPDVDGFMDLHKTKSADRLQAMSEPQVVGYVDGPNPSDAGIISLNERRSQARLNVDMSLAASHARAERLVQQNTQKILSAHDETDDSAAAQMPLSARLAALGESLELERKLREQKRVVESKQKEPERPLSRTEEFLRDGVPVDTEQVPANGTGVYRQFSLNAKPSPKKKEPRRPHTSSGTSSPTTPDAATLNYSKPERTTKPKHHTSHSTSAVELSPSLDSDLESSVTYTYKRTIQRSITPDPDNDLSRMSSLEGLETDTELGPSLYRVSTAPNSTSSRPKQRNNAINAKLTRMGIPPNANDLAGRPTPPKRFYGIRSFMQTLKGR